MKEYSDRESDSMLSAAEDWMPEQQTSDNMEVRAGFQPFYIVPLLYVISVYLIPVLLAVMSKWENTPVTYLLCLPLIFGIANIINAVKFCKPENRIMLLNAAVLVKYALIPFFLVGGLFEAASIFFSLIPVPFAIFLFGSIAVIGGVGGWMIVALGAPYVIAYLRLAFKEGLVPKWLAVILGILPFFFGVDVAAVMVLAMKERRWVTLTVIVIGLVILAVVLLVLLAVFGVIGMMIAGQGQ